MTPPAALEGMAPQARDFRPSLAVVSPAAQAAVDDIAAGCIVALVDPARPEGGGCLLAAAETVTADLVNVMLVHGRGTPWLALPEERCLALGLRRMGTPRPWDFQISIEARSGVTTGVSAEDRALTMRVASRPDSTSAHVIEPGHIMPIRVADDAIVQRAAAPEAAVELARRAGMSGGAAICWVLDDEGEAATPAEIARLASELGIKLVTTFDALDLRLRADRLVVAERDAEIGTAAGALRAVTYRDSYGGGRHYALLHGRPEPGRPTLLRVRLQDPLADVFGVRDDVSPGGIEATLAQVAAAPAAGALLYLAPAPLAPEAEAEDASALGRMSLLQAKRTAHVTTQMLEHLGIDTVQLEGDGEPAA